MRRYKVNVIVCYHLDIHKWSHSGDDSEENLITLCVDCHQRAHGLG
ncbi:MAG: HNH endonuclease [Acidobacteriia bacterium]|nr:HNH endonuclease [Terriglobia bacterium]